MKRAWLWLLLPLVPLSIGIAAIISGGFFMTTVLTLSCLIITVSLIIRNRCSCRSDWYVAVAFIFCIGGDFFLTRHHGSQLKFIMGVAMFAIAHLNYFVFMFCNGKISKRFGLIFTALLLSYFMIFLMTLNMPWPLKTAVLIYLLLSCLTLSAAIGMRLAIFEKALFIGGISLMIFSDLTISFKEFLHWHDMNFLIMPAYYFSLILICAGMCVKLIRSTV